MEARRDVFQAIADSTRRVIIDITQQTVNVKTIVEQSDVSRQAISLNLKILAECDLLNVQQSGFGVRPAEVQNSTGSFFTVVFSP